MYTPCVLPLMIHSYVQYRYDTISPFRLLQADYASTILGIQYELEQIWHANDSSAGGTLSNLNTWWDRILKLGPDFGYFVNASKSVIVKEDSLQKAETMFERSGIQITAAGGKNLGAVIGNAPSKKHL